MLQRLLSYKRNVKSLFSLYRKNRTYTFSTQIQNTSQSFQKDYFLFEQKKYQKKIKSLSFSQTNPNQKQEVIKKIVQMNIRNFSLETMLHYNKKLVLLQRNLSKYQWLQIKVCNQMNRLNINIEIIHKQDLIVLLQIKAFLDHQLYTKVIVALREIIPQMNRFQLQKLLQIQLKKLMVYPHSSHSKEEIIFFDTLLTQSIKILTSKEVFLSLALWNAVYPITLNKKYFINTSPIKIAKVTQYFIQTIRNQFHFMNNPHLVSKLILFKNVNLQNYFYELIFNQIQKKQKQKLFSLIFLRQCLINFPLKLNQQNTKIWVKYLLYIMQQQKYFTFRSTYYNQLNQILIPRIQAGNYSPLLVEKFIERIETQSFELDLITIIKIQLLNGDIYPLIKKLFLIPRILYSKLALFYVLQRQAYVHSQFNEILQYLNSLQTQIIFELENYLYQRLYMFQQQVIPGEGIISSYGQKANSCPNIRFNQLFKKITNPFIFNLLEKSFDKDKYFKMIILLNHDNQEKMLLSILNCNQFLTTSAILEKNLKVNYFSKLTPLIFTFFTHYWKKFQIYFDNQKNNQNFSDEIDKILSNIFNTFNLFLDIEDTNCKNLHIEEMFQTLQNLFSLSFLQKYPQFIMYLQKYLQRILSKECLKQFLKYRESHKIFTKIKLLLPFVRNLSLKQQLQSMLQQTLNIIFDLDQRKFLFETAFSIQGKFIGFGLIHVVNQDYYFYLDIFQSEILESISKMKLQNLITIILSFNIKLTQSKQIIMKALIQRAILLARQTQYFENLYIDQMIKKAQDLKKYLSYIQLVKILIQKNINNIVKRLTFVYSQKINGFYKKNNLKLPLKLKQTFRNSQKLHFEKKRRKRLFQHQITSQKAIESD